MAAASLKTEMTPSSHVFPDRDKCFHVLQEINMGQKASDTRGITFEDVEVPVEVGTVMIYYLMICFQLN